MADPVHDYLAELGRQAGGMRDMTANAPLERSERCDDTLREVVGNSGGEA